MNGLTSLIFKRIYWSIKKSVEGIQMNITALLLPGTLLMSWVAIAIGIYCLLSAKKQIVNGQRICEKLTRDLQVAGNGAAGMGQRIIALERKLLTMNVTSVDCTVASQPIMKNIEFKGANVNVANVKVANVKVDRFTPIDLESKNIETNYNKATIQQGGSNQNMKESLSVFDQAKQLLRNGISERQVVKTCGLSPDEVALMNVLIQNAGHQTSPHANSPQVNSSQANGVHNRDFQSQTRKTNVFA